MRATSTVAASIFAVVAGAATAQPAVTPGPSQPVKVTNDVSSPVPVAVQGGVAVTGPVTVGNTTSNPVPVSIQGTSVPVSIQGTAAVSGNVNLTNAFVPVTVIDDRLNAPLNLHGMDAEFLEVGEVPAHGSVNLSAFINVPDGKRFIVESVAIRGSIPLATPPLPVEVFCDCRGTQFGIPLQRTPSPLDNGFGQDEALNAVLPIRMRVDARTANSTPECEFRFFMRFPPGQIPTSTKLIRIDANLLGYEVDLL